MTDASVSVDRAFAPSLALSARRLILPLALAQFICSFAGSNMNVMINDISDDLDTTVKGVQTAITLFLLIMAILMIPCSKLTDRWGRKRCFTGGLVLYGIGAVISAVSPNLGVLILGNSVFEGVGTALLIPPVYILATLWFTNLTRRAWAFGVISGLGGIGAAAGPLIGGLITTAISWRAAFVFQAAVVGVIILLGRRITDPLPADPTRPFDAVGAVLSGAGMFCLVFGILQAGSNNTLFAVFLVIGVVLLAAFYLYIRARERAGKEPLLSTGVFRNRTCNFALVTQNIQWLILMGTSFVVSVYLQTVPQFVLAMLATWKAGGIMVSINPMNKARELEYLLADSGASVLVCLESLYEETAKGVVGSGVVGSKKTVSDRFSSRAARCIVSVLRPAPSSNTATGLPSSGARANASTTV